MSSNLTKEQALTALVLLDPRPWAPGAGSCALARAVTEDDMELGSQSSLANVGAWVRAGERLGFEDPLGIGTGWDHAWAGIGTAMRQENGAWRPGWLLGRKLAHMVMDRDGHAHPEDGPTVGDVS